MLAVCHMSESRIDEELIARGSRTHGTREQKEDRLYRFLEFEDQKKRRNEYVKQMKKNNVLEEEQAAQVLMDLRYDNDDHLASRIKALEDIVMNLEKRISDLEMPPLVPDSNPNHTYAWECTQFN